MIIPPTWDTVDRARGVKRELARDVSRLVEDLEFRRDFLREIWSVSRDRGAFLDSVSSSWRLVSADDLLELELEVVVMADAFYRALDDFQLYLQFTDDMPATLQTRYDRSVDKLGALGARLCEALGGDPGRPMVEFDNGTVHSHVRSLFAAPPRPPPPETTDEAHSEWAAETEAALARLQGSEDFTG